MLKKILLLSLFFLQTNCLNIIFALDELLFTIDKKTLNAVLGHENLTTKVRFWWYGGYTSKAALTKDIMDKLQSIPTVTQLSKVQQAFYAEQKVAPILCEWILGLRSSDEVRTAIINHIEHHPDLDQWVKNKLIEMAEIGLNPHKLIDVVELVPEGIELLERCYKTRRHNLYILSNCPAEIFDLLKVRFPHFFSYFSGYAISGQTHLIKPHFPIYHYLLEQYNLSPQDCLYIGTTRDGLIPALNLGMHALLWDPYNYEPGIKELINMGIL